jgi:hypothetical protein
MARYFFHTLNGKMLVDDVGVEFASMDEVRSETIRASGQMLSHGVQGWKGDAWQMIVADESGTIVFSVSFRTDHHGL